MRKDTLVLFKCVVCGASFVEKQALRGHLNAHRDIEWENFTVRLPREKTELFKRLCRKHNTTTCHLISTLMDAVIEGDKSGLVQVGAPNPLVINVNSYFARLPRGRGKYDFTLLNSTVLEERDYEPSKKPRKCYLRFCARPAEKVLEWEPTGTLYACCSIHADSQTRSCPDWKLRGDLEVSK